MAKALNESGKFIYALRSSLVQRYLPSLNRVRGSRFVPRGIYDREELFQRGTILLWELF
ncbi:MAG: hypothetical protein ACTS6G_00555 [Candidatus Hodgkinia cicadicola]